jgi:N-acetylglucosamine kinase-like BadF-type ATPase
MYLGVDGGGTKTAFVLIDRDGRVRATHQGGSAYYLEVGMDRVRALVNDGIEATLRAAGIGAAELDFAFFGLPIHGEDERTAELDQLPATTLGRTQYACGNDMVCGWAGSLAGADGINVVAGTGSICYGEYAGRAARCGGWGELFGDEGSAYWIACTGLRLFSRMSDGRSEQGPLYQVIREQLGTRRDIELTAWALSELAQGRSRFAGLARLVHAAAQRGDRQAAGIFELAARELAEVVAATRRTLQIPESTPVPVSFSGGVFSIGELVTAPFKAALQGGAARYLIVAPRFAPAVGAALYAAKLSGHPLSEAALAALAAQSTAEPVP